MMWERNNGNKAERQDSNGNKYGNKGKNEGEVGTGNIAER